MNVTKDLVRKDLARVIRQRNEEIARLETMLDESGTENIEYSNQIHMLHQQIDMLRQKVGQLIMTIDDLTEGHEI